ncbi:c-type cytochrome [Hyphomicrobium methylovorum]|uniref:c-type cytochrome n=1 Tax=Hyphomicrobium methylovorum TaxID=84 RepID=UPI001AEEA41C|nr:cytochrome c [Hyphomicrobium methylovorum]
MTLISSRPVIADDEIAIDPDDPQAEAKMAAAKAYKEFKARKPTPVENKPPLEVDKGHPLGSMKNPYTDQPDKIEEGKKLYFSYSCNGCHGGGGGGGMCPPLTNETWVYGSDDDILFRLISQGSQELQKNYGLARKGQESVVGPMPPFGELIKTDDELWKIVAFVHSLYKGSKRNW